MARVRAIEGEHSSLLSDGWECAPTAPGAADHPDRLGELDWVRAIVPGTAALAWTAAKRFDVETGAYDFDAQDWWYRRELEPHQAATLRLDGLATLADVWINGKHVLRSENMFITHEIDLGEALQDSGQIFVRFASLGAALKDRRPRPRWRAQIVRDQQLRFFRTTLLGRIPAWAPPVAPVGPYRRASLVTHGPLRVLSANVRPSKDAIDATLRLRAASPIAEVTLLVGDTYSKLSVETQSDGSSVARGRLNAKLAAWWPHTHGMPTLHSVNAIVRTSAGETRVDLGRTGLRTVTVDRDGGRFALRINGEPIFCRGAVFTPLDPVGLQNDPAVLRHTLEQARDAGMNMIRIGGTSLYECDLLHDVCDELGILVWQDLMFANMDYPVQSNGDAFSLSVRGEISGLLDRLQLSPSLAVVCGGSEVEQQAAMMGLPVAEWSSPLFAEQIPALVRASVDVPYVPSTPTAGAMPFDVDVGVAHYYGVGAYLRPIEDARRANVRFAAECLAFANVPADETIEALLADGEMPTTHPRWKARVPRDKGASWDFDDVRDHYMRVVFGIDPMLLRRTDVARYLELARVTTAEVMASAMTEWRRPGSSCAGALVWILRDFWLGAGWGIIDVTGRPKAAWYALKRTLAPIALLATDEGLSGLALHVVNDSPNPVVAELRVALFRGEARVGEGAQPVTVSARSATTMKAEAILGRFHDTTYAYRFGPPGHDLVLASLVAGDRVIATAFHFPTGIGISRSDDLGIAATATAQEGAWRVVVRTKKLATAVAIDARGFVADDSFFHIEPGGERIVTLRPAGKATALSARVVPLNAITPTKVVVSPS